MAYKNYENLYLKDIKDNIRVWKIKVVDNVITIQFGELGSHNLITNNETINEGKNIGKSNETTLFEQAVKEANARWKHKTKEGYKSCNDLNIPEAALSNEGLKIVLNQKLSINRTNDKGELKCMKAQKYLKDDDTPRITFPCFAQPKINGVRCFSSYIEQDKGEGLFQEKVKEVVLRGKENIEYSILTHIKEEMLSNKHIFNNSDYIFDGELYIPGEILSNITSAVRKKNSNTSKVKLYIFDIAVENYSQKERLRMLDNILHCNTLLTFENIVKVPTIIINSHEEATKFTDKCIEEGYEGAIFRDMNAEYGFGRRVKTMVKFKRFKDSEFEIVDVIPQEKSPTHANFICKNDKNSLTFVVTPEGTFEQKEQYLKDRDKLIGKLLTVKYYERTINDLPFHSVGIAVRDYE